jgi:type IV fimbrial biogenesis protein FimT
MSHTNQRGVTLVEASAVLGVAAVLAASGVPGFGSMLERRQIDGASAELTADLQLIRSEAVSRNQNLTISFGQTPSGRGCYVIHTGPAAACTCGDTGPAQCIAGADEIKTVRDANARTRLHANVDHMTYESTRGTTTPGGSIYVTGAGGQTLRHVVSMMGRVRTCSPDGSLPRQQRC